MINILKLKKTFVKSFKVDVEDEESTDEEDGKKDVTISAISNDNCHRIGVSLENNKKFANIKVFVKSWGQRVERFVGIDTDFDELNARLEDNTDLNQVMTCSGLEQIEKLILKPIERRNTFEDNYFETKNNSKTFNSTLNQKLVKTKKSKKKSKKAKKPKQSSTDLKQNQTIVLLELEGIQCLSGSNWQSFVFKCFICDITLTNADNAIIHSESESHSKCKFGDNLKGIDALFTIDSERIGDVEIAISRRIELQKIDLNDKQKYFSHGIRLKDGFGANAYICSKCNLCFESLTKVRTHITSLDECVDNSCVDTIDKQIEIIGQESNDEVFNDCKTNINEIDVILKNEGINRTELSDEQQFYCTFCNIYFDCNKTVSSHLKELRHKKAKLGENLNECDNEFVTQTDRIDELKVSFARKDLLKNISQQKKNEFSNEGIRLKDGFGFDAFVCLKCHHSIGSVEDIEAHIKSLGHILS